MASKKDTWQMVVKIIIAVASAILGAIGGVAAHTLI